MVPPRISKQKTMMSSWRMLRLTLIPEIEKTRRSLRGKLGDSKYPMNSCSDMDLLLDVDGLDRIGKDCTPERNISAMMRLAGLEYIEPSRRREAMRAKRRKSDLRSKPNHQKPLTSPKNLCLILQQMLPWKLRHLKTLIFQQRPLRSVVPRRCQCG